MKAGCDFIWPTHFIVVDVGCIECGISTEVHGPFAELSEAESIRSNLPLWRDGGQSNPTIYGYDSRTSSYVEVVDTSSNEKSNEEML